MSEQPTKIEIDGAGEPTEEELARIQNFEIAITRCSITGEIDKCIAIPLATGKVPIVTETGETITDPVTGDTKFAEFDIIGHFSERGLRAIQHKLQEAENPVFFIKSPEEVRSESSYQWLAIYPSGQRIYQYPAEGGETMFSTVHIPDVHSFWITSRLGRQINGEGKVRPAYGLTKDLGFVIVRENGGEMEVLNLPWPGPDTSFWFQYYRRIFRRGVMGGGGRTTEEPAYIKQILGWRIEGAKFEISIEDDGSWQPYSKEPLDHPLFAASDGEEEETAEVG